MGRRTRRIGFVPYQMTVHDMGRPVEEEIGAIVRGRADCVLIDESRPGGDGMRRIGGKGTLRADAARIDRGRPGPALRTAR